MQTYQVTAHSAAQASTIYRVLLAGETWPEWMHVDHVTTQKASLRKGPDEVGDIREVRTGKYVNHEKIVELIPNKLFRYTILDGILHEYRGEVALVAFVTGGTNICWQGTFRMTLPGAAWLMKFYLRRFMQRAVNDLARFAEQQESVGK